MKKKNTKGYQNESKLGIFSKLLFLESTMSLSPGCLATATWSITQEDVADACDAVFKDITEIKSYLLIM
jgi:hypothetical protein